MISNRRRLAMASVATVFALGPIAGATAEQSTEPLRIGREHRGKAIEVPAALSLPPGTHKVPAMIIHHGSGGVTEAREGRYARELVGIGVAAVVIDSFKPRGITDTVSDQSQVSSAEMANDAFAALKVLAAHPRINPSRIGILGFSKGGTVVLMTALESRAARALPRGMRFALHIPIYPACNNHYLDRRSAGGPMLMLIGGADTYAGVAPCTEWGDKLKAAGGNVTVKVYPGAEHGFDGERPYNIAKGENWSRCVFDEQPDGSWKDRASGATTNDAQGRRIELGFKTALANCMTRGVSGGPNVAAKSAAMEDLKAAVRRHLPAAR